MKVDFEYRPYAGFVENLYSTSWHRSPLTELSENKDFSTETNEVLKPEEYEYRAIVVHPRMTVYGDIKGLKRNKT